MPVSFYLSDKDLPLLAQGKIIEHNYTDTTLIPEPPAAFKYLKFYKINQNTFN